MNANRRTCLTDEVTPEERHALRALVGSLQHASANARPDLASRLSFIQSVTEPPFRFFAMQIVYFTKLKDIEAHVSAFNQSQSKIFDFFVL